MKDCNYFLFFFLVLGLLTFPGCVPENRPDDIQPAAEEGNFEPGSDESDENGRPVGWTEDSHGKNVLPNYTHIFDHNNVLRMDIVISPSHWQAMLEDMKENYGPFGVFGYFNSFAPKDQLDFWLFGPDENPVYVPCDLVFNEKTWHHVGIRFKGNSTLKRSWNTGSYKLPFRLTFDKFEDDFPEIKNQRFYGFKKLGLSNGVFDKSLVREKIANEIYRDAGIPVGRDAFCRVFIDYGEGKKYFGLYTLQELPDKPMLKSIFTEDHGNLYKPEGNSASFKTWNPDDFDKETNKDEADFSDIHKLYTVLHSDRKDEAAFKARLEEVFNVDGFLHYLAVNQVICNWDTYGITAHNYYLYHNPGDDKLHWIPFDFDFSLQPVGFMPALSLELGPLEVTQKWPLIRYLLDVDEYHSRYVHYVKKTIDEVFYPQRMQAIIDDTYYLVSPYVVGEQGEVYLYSNLSNYSNFEQAFTFLHTHVTNRHEAARRFVEKYRSELNNSN